MVDTSIKLFKEITSSIKDIIEYTANSKTFSGKFSNQFSFSELNEECYNCMYLKKDKNVVPRKFFLQSIKNLEATCSECWKFYLPKRNESEKGLDIQLGKKFEEKFCDFLNNNDIKCEGGDTKNKIFPDKLIKDKDGKIIAYLEVKYQSAPWIFAYQEPGTNRECYEGSPAMDIKKLKNQWNLFENGEITAPIYYVFWLDFPCIKGIFSIDIKDLYRYYQNEAKIFTRKDREGDFKKTKDGIKRVGHTYKIHPSIFTMGSFSELLKVLR